MALLPLMVVGPVLKPAGVDDLLDIDLTLLCYLLVAAVAAYELIRSQRYPVGRMAPFLLFAAVVIWGIALSEVGAYQGTKTRDFFAVVIVGLCMPLFLRDLRDLKGLIAAWILAGLLAAGFVFAVGGSELLSGRAGIGGNTLGPAYLVATALVATVTAWRERELHWAFAAPAAVLCTMALLSIGSRGPVLAAMAGVALWVLLGGLSFRWSSLGAGVVLAVAILLGFRAAPEESLQYLSRFNASSREDLWATAWGLFLEHPLFGVGWGDFSLVGRLTYPHNLFLEVAAELGLIGLGALLFLMASLIAQILRNRHRSGVRVLAAVATVHLVGQQFSSDLSNRLFWVAVIPTLLFGGLRAASIRDGAQEDRF